MIELQSCRTKNDLVDQITWHFMPYGFKRQGDKYVAFNRSYQEILPPINIPEYIVNEVKEMAATSEDSKERFWLYYDGNTPRAGWPELRRYYKKLERIFH